jgi:uncharacterized protein with GYD domain
MAMYLIEATYTTEGVRGLLKDGGTKRREAVQTAVKKAGGKLEGFYFGFGGTDAFVLLDGLDNETAASIALTVAASGAVHTRTTVLLTPAQVDKACTKTIKYRAPGQ